MPLHNWRICILLVACLSVPARAQDPDVGSLTFCTEIYPPLNYEEGGQVTGIAPDVLIEMLQRLDAPQPRADIVVLPWARAYARVESEKNTVLFSTVRTQARDSAFKWIGPIAPADISVIAKKDLRADIRTIDDFSRYVVGVINQDVAHIALMDAGAKPKFVYDVRSPMNAIPMLERGRLDLWASGATVSFWLIQHHGYSPAAYEVVYTLEQSDYYFAVNKQTDDALVKALSAAFEDVKRDGTLKKILARYLSGGVDNLLYRRGR
ncbi:MULTISPECIES: substrate-binding periplasmic protein [Kordiimonas]|jgi:ABC-type amino acid transport substrate-binding protein|uniref:substrate-binding periplasmic protein n=1 Tax=Kordiimonas TaxID=288021 RepID=UPI00257C976C|nr:transporter substrate-binding domain-containing protein [Kordiimonas sp. UBA4487]